MVKRIRNRKIGVPKIVVAKISVNEFHGALLDRCPIPLPQPLQHQGVEFLVVSEDDVKPTIASRMGLDMANFSDRLAIQLRRLESRLLDGVFIGQYCIVRREDAEELEPSALIHR